MSYFAHTYKNLPTFLGLLSGALFLLFLLVFYVDQFSTFKQSVIFFILLGYCFLVYRNAQHFFNSYSQKTFKISELHTHDVYTPSYTKQQGQSEFEKQLRNINTEMQINQRQAENYSYRKSSYKTFCKSNKRQFESQQYMGRTSLRSLQQSFHNQANHIENISIIEEIKMRIKPKNETLSYRQSIGSMNSKFSTKVSQNTLKIFKQVGVSQQKREICLQIVDDYLRDSITTILSRYDMFYKQLSNLVSTCFGLELTIHHQYHKQERQSISLNELELLVQIIKRQKCLPKIYRSFVKLQELPSYMTTIEAILKKLPDFQQSSCHLALEIYVDVLRGQFSQPIMIVQDKISVFIYEDKPNINYFVKNKDGTVGYTKYRELRSKQAKEVVLLYMINVLKQEYKCDKRVIRQLKNYVEIDKSSQKK